MGFTPSQVDQMTFWEFVACVDGYAAAHGGDGPKGGGEGMDESRLKELGIEGF